MKARILGYVAQEINRLTSDEDMRQELWLYFLEGNSPFSLEDKLVSIRNEDKKRTNIMAYVSMETLNGIKEKL